MNKIVLTFITGMTFCGNEVRCASIKNRYLVGLFDFASKVNNIL